jgi:hypothetical protein
MFNIVATVCFLQLTNLPPVCLSNAYIPFDFKTKNECLLKRNVLVQEIDEDLKKRHVSMFLYCIEKPKVQSADV